MKNKRYIAIVMVLLVVMAFFLLETDEQKKQTANLVSLKTNTIEQTINIQNIKQQLKNKSFNSKEVTDYVVQSNNQVSKDWSYLAIYRRMEWANVCGRYFWFAFRNKGNPSSDFVTTLTKNHHQKDAQTELDPRAISGLKRYQEYCEGLKTAVFTYAQVDESEVNQGNTVFLELEHLLETTPAKTQKEKHIKTHFELTKSFYQARKNLEEVKKQSVKLNDQEKSSIYSEMRALSEEINDLENSLDSQEALASYEFLVAEIKKLDDQLVNIYDTENEAYQAAWSQLLQQWMELQVRLIGDDPDVFKLVKLAAEWSNDISRLGMSFSYYRSEQGFPLRTPGEQMMESFGIEAAHTFAEAAQPAAVLYLCGLGYDCSAESVLAMQLCLGYYLDMPEACQVSVQDFYLNHAMSPNLLEDVLILYQWMEDNYAT
ncbi:hypothetical protein [Marinicella rhabdoformis]|uniref:hypothetical protein n=1 Tax=Marinicella rhabdoformis TaxID=2580566 RepID=UPI0012AECCD8|nr:hypothetical protein [Marinicella rhabdoformis]